MVLAPQVIHPATAHIAKRERNLQRIFTSMNMEQWGKRRRQLVVRMGPRFDRKGGIQLSIRHQSELQNKNRNLLPLLRPKVNLRSTLGITAALPNKKQT